MLMGRLTWLVRLQTTDPASNRMQGEDQHPRLSINLHMYSLA